MAEQGPGWGFMWIYEPWKPETESNDAQTSIEVFATFEDARAAALELGLMTRQIANEGTPSAASLLRSCRSGENVLISFGELKDAFAIYQVAPGQSSRSAGTAFFQHWKTSVSQHLVMRMDKPSASAWYGWNPHDTQPAQSSGGGGSCAVLLLALVLLGWLGTRLAERLPKMNRVPTAWKAQKG